MKHHPNTDSTVLPYNKEVKAAFLKILKYAKASLSGIERDELRYTLIREEKPRESQSYIIYEMINPLLYLRLESHSGGLYSIHYGYEAMPIVSEYYALTASFMRFIYKATMSVNTTINIEDALRIDFVIANCSEMYEHIEERNRHHTFQNIKYKPAANRRKQMKAVA